MKIKNEDKTYKIIGIILTSILLIYGSICFFTAFLPMCKFDNDNFFQFAHAKEIFKNGFIRKDPLSMHDFDFIYPQWLFAVLIYSIKTVFGNNACVWMFIILFIFIIYLLYKNYIELSNNKNVAFLITFLLGSTFGAFFLKMRPHMFSAALIALEFYFIEKYIRTKDKRIFIINFIISVLYINLHNSLWIFLFLLHLCYIGEYIGNIILKRDQEFELKYILLITIISLLGGLVNPYGFDGIMYIFNSMESIKPFQNFITELKSPFAGAKKINSLTIIIAIMVIPVITNISKNKLRYLFLFFGTLIMALISKRSMLLFLIGGGMAFTYSLKDWEIKYINFSFLKRGILFLSILFILFSLIPLNVKEHRAMDDKQYDAIDWLAENEKNKDVKIFNSFDSGSYLAYKGFHPYIDARAEVYGIANNKKDDIASEYINLIKNDFKGFGRIMKKYNFDYLILSKTQFERSIINYIEKYPNNFEKVYEDEFGWIYKTITNPEKENKKNEDNVKLNGWATANYKNIICYKDGKRTTLSEIIPEKNGIIYLYKNTCKDCKEYGPKIIDIAEEKKIPHINLEIINDEEIPSSGYQIKRNEILDLNIHFIPAVLMFQNERVISLLENKSTLIEDLVHLNNLLYQA